MQKYLLLAGKEGSDWKALYPIAVGNLNFIQRYFGERSKPFILWFLVDLSNIDLIPVLPDELHEFFTHIENEHKNISEKDYKVEPFVGFYDTVATSRSWGILKDIS